MQFFSERQSVRRHVERCYPGIDPLRHYKPALPSRPRGVDERGILLDQRATDRFAAGQQFRAGHRPEPIAQQL